MLTPARATVVWVFVEMSPVGRTRDVRLSAAPHCVAAQYPPVLLHHVASPAVVEVTRVLTLVPFVFIFRVVLASEMKSQFLGCLSTAAVTGTSPR